MFNSVIKEQYQLPAIRLLRSGQLTLPAKIRQLLGLEEGTFLGAELDNNRIILTPQKLVKEDKAKERLFNLTEKIWERNKNISAKEAEESVSKTLEAIRRQSL